MILKIGPILVQYLLRHKQLALQGLGVFTIDSAANPVYDEERQTYNSNIQFYPDTKAPEDPALIQFIVEQSGKIKPLAIADLDSYLAAGKQLLNISKPFVIEGLGTLNRDSHNNVEFAAGTVASQVSDDSSRHNKPKSSESYDAINFHDNYLKPPRAGENMMRKLLIAAACLVGIAIIAWVVYFFLYHEETPVTEPNKTVVSTPPVTSPDTANSNTSPIYDSTKAQQTDSVKPVTQAPVTAAATPATATGYNIVIEYASKARALKRYADLRDWGIPVQISTKDSVQYKLFFNFTGPLSDTTHKKDSISRYYARKVFVEMNP